MKIHKTCICGDEIETTQTRIESGRGKFCSKKCQYANATRPSGLRYSIKVVNKGWIKKGQKAWSAGKLLKKWDEYSPDLSYKHKIIRKKYGVPVECVECKTNVNLQWSNVSGEYKEDRADWQTLCARCHHRYDYKQFGARVSFFN